ncbi:MAG TPA: cohesin domain-containing protein, partial [Bacteroidales bacterium]|nr:cohesin domain-containing protein [Bacteroidales bacterium]
MPKLEHSKVFITGIILTIFLSCGGIISAQTDPLGFSLSGTSVTEKDTFVVALKADSVLTGSSVYAYRFYLSYSPSYFEFIGTEGTGPVLSTWGMPVLNDSNQGTVVMAGAGTSPLSGNGNMLYLKFVSLRSGYSTISFNTPESYLNEGNPASVYSNVTIYSAALSYPDIYPDYRDMYVGDEVK